MSDRIFGAFGLLFAALMAWATTLIEESFIQDPLGPKAFALVIAALVAVSSLVMLLKPDAEPTWPPLAKWLELTITIGVMVGYAVILPELGFVISSSLITAFLIHRLGGTLVQSAAGGVLISVGVFVVFSYGLHLSLAKGPWGF